MRGYCAIAREASKHPDRLAHFLSDLITHDRALLTDYDGPFLWCLNRNGGTATLKPGFTNLTVNGIISAYGWDQDSLWFWFDGRFLRPVHSPEEARDLVSEVERDLWHVVSSHGEVVLGVYGARLYDDACRKAESIEQQTKFRAYVYQVKGRRPNVGASLAHLRKAWNTDQTSSV